MKNYKFILIHLFILTLIIGNLIPIITQKSNWPFVRYGMYSDLLKNKYRNTMVHPYSKKRVPKLAKYFSMVVLEGVDDQGQSAGLLFPERRPPLIVPLDRFRLIQKVSRLIRSENDLHGVLSGLLFLHNNTNSPHMAGIRLYRYKWNLEIIEQSISTTPHKKELITEVFTN